MLIFLPVMMLWMLLRAQTAILAAREACRLFAVSVLPGLMPYMVLSLLLLSRIPRPMPLWLLVALGWCGGSPTGARLLQECPGLPSPAQRRAAVMCATMSPMFLLGTAGEWLGSWKAGAVALAAVLLSAWLTGLVLPRGDSAATPSAAPQPLGFGQAVQAAAQTMLMVCGTMVMMRVFAALLGEWTQAACPPLTLPLTTLVEVTGGVQAIASLPLPLALRTALAAGSCGFGGAAILLQNRSALPKGLFSLPAQTALQAVHGLAAFLLALGMMQLWG